MGLRKSGRRARDEREESSADPWERGILAGGDDDPIVSDEVASEEVAEGEPVADDPPPDDADPEGGDAGDEGMEARVPESLASFFEAHLDEEGSLPPGIDQFFAGVSTLEDDDAREASYAAVPGGRTPDYIPRIQAVAPVEMEEDEMTAFDRLGNYVKAYGNLGVRALNEIIGTDIKEMELPRSMEEDWWLSMTKAAGAPLAIGGAVTAVGAVAGLPAMAAGLVGFGAMGVHSLLASYDDPGNMELYDSLIPELFGWEGFIPSDPAEWKRMTRGEKYIRIHAADTLDYVTGGVVLKGGKKVWGTLRPRAKRISDSIGEEGKLNIRAWTQKEYDPSFMHENTPAELAGRLERMDGKTLDYVTERLNKDTTQEALTSLRMAYDRLGGDAFQINLLKKRHDDLNRHMRTLIPEHARVKEPANPDKAVDGAWKAFEADASDETLSAFVATSDAVFKKINVKREMVDASEDVTEEILERFRRRMDVTGRLMKNAGKTDAAGKWVDTARMDGLLGSARDYIELHSIADMGRTGIRLQQMNNLEMNFRALRKYEDKIMDLLERKARGYFSKADEDVYNKLDSKWKSQTRRLLDPTGRSGLNLYDDYVAMALNVYYDNILSKGALALSVSSGAASLVGRTITRGYKGLARMTKTSRLLGHPAHQIRLKSVWSRTVRSYQDRFSKKNAAELKDILTGVKKPRRYDKRGYENVYVGKNPVRKAWNAFTGTARFKLHLVDEIMGGVHDVFSEVSAMEKLLQGNFHDPKKLKEFADDLMKLDHTSDASLQAFMKKYPDYMDKYMQEVNFQTDVQLFRANPEQFSDMGATARLGTGMYRFAVKHGHYSENAGARFAAHTLASFPRVWANTLYQADRLTPIGLARGKGFVDALGSPERQVGTLLGMGGLLMYLPDLDGVKVVDAASSEGDLRKLGGKSGIIIGDHAIPWDYMGTYGTAMKHLTKAFEVMRLTPVSGDILNAGLDDAPGTEDPWLTRLGNAAGLTLNYMVTDSFFERNMMMMLSLAFRKGSGEPIIEELENIAGQVTNPGLGFVRRVTSLFHGGGGAPVNENDPVFMGYVSELAALLGDEPPEARRDDFGVPWNAGEMDMEETSWMGQAYGRSMYFINPNRRNPTPKSNAIRHFLLENAAISGGSVVANGKVIDEDLYRVAFGVKPPRFTGVDRNSTGADGQPFRLDRTAQNEKVTLISLDWDAIGRVMGRHEAHWDATPRVKGDPLDDYLRQTTTDIKSLLTWKGARGVIKEFHPAATEKTRMVDVLHHIATAPLKELGGHGRSVVKDTMDTYMFYAAEQREFIPKLRELTDEDIRVMALNHGRISLMNELYNWFEKNADAAMEASPAGAEIRAETRGG